MSVYFTRAVNEADKSILFVYSKQDADISVYVEETALSRNQLLALLVFLKIT
jgi:hypothetical protein